MKVQTLFLAVMAAISLAACSSSGGGSGVKANGNGTSSSASNGASNNKPIVKEDTAEAFALNQQQTTFKQTLKNGEPVSMSNGEPTLSASNNDGDNFKTIQVGNQKFTLNNTGKKYMGGFVGEEKDAGEYKIATDTAYARYGFTINYKNADWTLFYQGQPTDVAKMPTAGSVVYVGRAFAINPKVVNATGMENEGFYGDSIIEANFDSKKVNGAIYWSDNWLNGAKQPANTIFEEADIRGNTFKGANSEGRFYGPNAENVAGAFEDKKQGLHGVFGGVKQ